MKKAMYLLFLIPLIGCGGGGGGGNSPAGSSPVVTLSAATFITENSAIFNGTVNPNGLPTECWFEYGSEPSLATYDNSAKQPVGSGNLSQSVSYTCNGLNGGTTYYFRICASNSLGAIKSSTASFATSPPSKTQMGGSIQGAPLTLAGISSTVAGVPVAAGSQDGTGAAARFFGPLGVTTDGTNLYVADIMNHTIRQVVIATGEVTTLAGTPGSFGSADGVGAAARFMGPTGVTTDGTNLYVAEEGNHTIRKVEIATGEVTTLAGTPGVSGSADGVGAAARFFGPHGITTDGTSLYVTDYVNNTIRRVGIATGAVTTLAGTAPFSGSTDGIGATAGFNGPIGITTDGTNLFVVDTWNHTIRKVVIARGEVTTLAGAAGSSGFEDGTGAAAKFYAPYGITTDGTNLYVTDCSNHTIRQVVISTGEVTTLAGAAGSSGFEDGTDTAARFDLPTGITTDGTRLLIGDFTNNTIRAVN